MALSYRSRRVWRGIGAFLLVLALVLVLAAIVWLLWIDRYMIYTRDGAKLDFSLSEQLQVGEVAVPPQAKETTPIYYNEGDNAINTSTELAQMYGYYITTDMLLNDGYRTMQILRTLPAQTPVMIELKDIRGRFYYNSSMGPINSKLDMAQAQQIISFITDSGLYAIAKFPALRDYTFGLENVPYGLPAKGYNGALWMDMQGCYWLDASKEGTVGFLIQIITELKTMGFDEVVLGDFMFPDTDRIVYSKNKKEVLQNAAARLVEACGSSRFAVSFVVSDAEFALPAGRTRLYLEGKTAGEAKQQAELATVPDNLINLAFITDLKDSRFDNYSVLRPLTLAAVEE